MKKFLKSLGQLNNSQIRVALSVIYHAIEETATAKLQGENIQVIAQSTITGDVHVNIVTQDEDHTITTDLSFIYKCEGGFFTAVVMQEIPIAKPVQISGANFLTILLNGGTTDKAELN